MTNYELIVYVIYKSPINLDFTYIQISQALCIWKYLHVSFDPLNTC